MIERAVIFADGDEIEPDHIVLTEEHRLEELPMPGIGSVKSSASLYDIEKELIVRALQQENGNQTRAAKSLGLSLDTLRYRIKKYQIRI